jgi:hypothetical protein
LLRRLGLRLSLFRLRQSFKGSFHIDYSKPPMIGVPQCGSGPGSRCANALVQARYYLTS